MVYEKRRRTSKPIETTPVDAFVLKDGTKYRSILGGIAKDYQLGQDPSIRDDASIGQLIFLVAGYSQQTTYEGEIMGRQVFFEEWLQNSPEDMPKFYLELKPEPENKYDSNAVNILFRSDDDLWKDWDGFSVGYVPKRIAYYLKQNLSLIKQIDIANIVKMQNDDLAWHLRVTYNNEYLDEIDNRINKRFSKLL